MNKTSTHFIGTLIRQAHRLNLDVERILSETGIPLEYVEVDNLWIDNSYFIRLAKRLWAETQDETIGFDFVPFRPGSTALIFEFMLSAENLGAFYRQGERILSFVSPDSNRIVFNDTVEEARVQFFPYTDERDPDHFMAEFWGVCLHRFACWAIDEHIPLRKAWFSYPKPAHAHLYDELFHCDVEFDHESNGFSFSRRYLSRAVNRSKLELEHWLRDSPADLLYLPGRETSVHSLIKTQLTRQLRDELRFFAFERVCEALCMSPQVVRRRLLEEGTSYQKIKDAVRLDLIRELLANPNISIADIAERAGFAEPGALSRAFKKWTGLTPLEYRQKHSPR